MDWEVRKQKLNGDDSHHHQLQSQSSPEGLGNTAGVEGQTDGKLHAVGTCKLCVGACTCKYIT